jgi:hypothetical protein
MLLDRLSRIPWKGYSFRGVLLEEERGEGRWGEGGCGRHSYWEKIRRKRLLFKVVYLLSLKIEILTSV